MVVTSDKAIDAEILHGTRTSPNVSAKNTPRKRRKKTFSRSVRRVKVPKKARLISDPHCPSGGQTSITEKPRSQTKLHTSTSSRNVTKADLVKDLASSRRASSTTKRELESSRVEVATLDRKKQRLDKRQLKDKTTISSLGALLADSRKLGKKTSSELATKDNEREVSVLFVHLFSVLSYEC